MRMNAELADLTDLNSRKLFPWKRFEPNFRKLASETKLRHPGKNVGQINRLSVLAEQHRGVRAVDHSARHKLEQNQVVAMEHIDRTT
jgi:hypothetical protein